MSTTEYEVYPLGIHTRCGGVVALYIALTDRPEDVNGTRMCQICGALGPLAQLATDGYHVTAKDLGTIDIDVSDVTSVLTRVP